MGRPFDPKSQVMATSEMAGSGPITNAWEAVGLNMALSTRKQTAFNLLSVTVVASKAAAKGSVSGVTMAMMDQ